MAAGTYTSRFKTAATSSSATFQRPVIKSLIVDGSGDGLSQNRLRLRASQPGARQNGWPPASTARLPLEQLPALFTDRGPPARPGCEWTGWLASMASGRQARPAGSNLSNEWKGATTNRTKTAWQAIRRGWCLGGKEFRQELLAELGERAGENHAGPELAESEEQKALGIVEQNCGAADDEGQFERWRQRG